jgi:hypothetical protein
MLPAHPVYHPMPIVQPVSFIEHLLAIHAHAIVVIQTIMTTLVIANVRKINDYHLACHHSCVYCDPLIYDKCTDCGINSDNHRTLTLDACPCDEGFYNQNLL